MAALFCMKKVRNREVDRSEYRAYLKVAQEYLASAQDNLTKNRFIPACGNAVHAVIAAADALTVFSLGRRSTGQSHMDAIHLLKQVAPDEEDLRQQITRFQRILGLKDAAEYLGGDVDQDDARSAIRDTERFLSFVRNHVR